MPNETSPEEERERLAEAMAWLLEYRAGVPARGLHQPADLNDPAVANAIAALSAEIVERKDMLAAISIARGMRQPQRRECLLAARIQMNVPEAAVGRYLGQVYLKLFADGIYKIGETGNPDKRLYQLEIEYQTKVYHNKEFYSPVAHRLEQSLIRHFNQFRVLRGGARELFDLPLELVARFEEIATEVENWVFNAEEARLKLEVLRIETECDFFRLDR